MSNLELAMAMPLPLIENSALLAQVCSSIKYYFHTNNANFKTHTILCSSRNFQLAKLMRLFLKISLPSRLKNAHVALALGKKFFTIWNLNTLASQQVIYLLICELLDYYWWQLLEESLNWPFFIITYYYHYYYLLCISSYYSALNFSIILIGL